MDMVFLWFYDVITHHVLIDTVFLLACGVIKPYRKGVSLSVGRFFTLSPWCFSGNMALLLDLIDIVSLWAYGVTSSHRHGVFQCRWHNIKPTFDGRLACSGPLIEFKTKCLRSAAEIYLPLQGTRYCVSGSKVLCIMFIRWSLFVRPAILSNNTILSLLQVFTFSTS